MNFFLGNTRLVVLIVLGFALAGSKGLLRLKRESIPPVDFARVLIATVYPGSSPAEVEELITAKIEDEIRSISHLKDVQSVSQPGLSLISIRLDIDKGDTQETVNKLSQALRKVRGLPAEVLDPPRLEHIDSSNEKPLIVLFVAGPDQDRLRGKLSFQLKTELERIRGVSEVRLKNYREREFLVALSPEKMQEHYVSSADVIAALRQKSLDVPAGYLEGPDSRVLVRVLGKPRSARDLEETIIRSNFSGQKVLIKDIARVADGPEKEEERSYFYQPEAGKKFRLMPVTSLELMKAKEADALSAAAQVKKTIKKFKRQLSGKSDGGCGEACKIFIGFDEGKNIKNRLVNVINNALIGLLLIFIVFFLFLPSRVGIMAAFSLPLSVLGAFSILPLFGVSFNVITMLAFVICVGMLVDNSVVIAEYYSRRAIEGKIAPAKAAVEAVVRFWKPVTATALTTIAAFLPMLVTTGVMGQFIKWIPLVIATALLMSLFESFCLLPNRLQWFSPKKHSPRREIAFGFFRRAERGFEKLLKKTVSSKYISLGLIALLILATAVLFKTAVRVDLFSSRSPEFYTALLEPKPNTPLPIIDRKAKRAAEKMSSLIGGDKTVQWISVQSNFREARILLKVKPSALRHLKYKNILDSFRREIKAENLKTLGFGILAPGPPVGKPLSAAIQSNSRREIRKFIDEVFPEVEKIPGVLNLKSNPDNNQGIEYQVRPDAAAMARLGLDFPSVGMALRAALEGHLITELTENRESFYIRVRQEEERLSSVEHLKKIKIRERMGRLVPLSKAAEIKAVKSEPDRKTYNFEPVVFLEADIDRKAATSMEVNRRAKKIIAEKIKKYPSLAFKMIGEQETVDESLRSLRAASIIAFFSILIILVVLFKSFLLSFLILTCIPLGMIGVIWAFFLHQRDLNFFALIGVVGLAGVVVNSAIILVSYILRLREEEPERPLSEVAVQASKERFRPIMLTNLTTLGGLLPTAYGIAGFEPLLMPMTLAFFWGLLAAALLTLIWIPCAALAFEDGKNLWRRLMKKTA